MIRTECQRRIIKNNITPPEIVLNELKRHDKALELIFNTDKNQWEFYRLKHKGIIDDEDVLHWQMSAPTKGTDISVGIVEWLRQYDTSAHGRLSADDLRDQWVKNVKNIFYNQEMRRAKELEEANYSFKEALQDFETQKTVVAVTSCVGFNKKRNKRIYAVKKGAVNKEMRNARYCR